MSDNKISSISLYVVAAISMVVVLFFYVAPKTVNIDELDARVEQLLTEGVVADQVDAEAPVEIDSTAVDSLGMASADSTEVVDSDSVLVAAATTQMETPEAILTEVNLRDHLSAWELMVYKRTDYALRWAYVLLIIAGIAALIFPLISIVTDVKAILRLLAIVAGAAVLVSLSYFIFASDATISILGYTGTDNSDPATLKWIDTGLFSTYIIFGIALMSILYSEIANLFK